MNIPQAAELPLCSSHPMTLTSGSSIACFWGGKSAYSWVGRPNLLSNWDIFQWKLYKNDDVFGLHWEDSKTGSKDALISQAWNYLKDCSFNCCIRSGRTSQLGLRMRDFSVCLGFLTTWQPQLGQVCCKTPSTSVSVNKAEIHWLLWVHSVTSAVFCCLQASHKMAQFRREENLTSPFNEGVTREWETVAASFEEYNLPQPTGFWEAEVCIQWHCLELPGNYIEQIVGFIIASCYCLHLG